MTTASKFTLARVVMIPAFMALLLFAPQLAWLKWLALAVFILASVTDFIDGHIARKYHQVTDFGKFLDPLADKLLVISAMAIFCEWGQFPAWDFMIVLAREFAVTGLRLIAVGNGTVIAAGWSGKVKTFATMIALGMWIAAWDLPLIAWARWVFIAVIVGTTLYSGIEYFIKNWRCLGLKKKN